MDKVYLPARAKSVLKVETPEGNHIDLETPKGQCLVQAMKQLCDIVTNVKIEVVDNGG